MDTDLSSLALGDSGLSLAWFCEGEPAEGDGIVCVSIRKLDLGLGTDPDTSS